jgi:hypothetical protein
MLAVPPAGAPPGAVGATGADGASGPAFSAKANEALARRVMTGAKREMKDMGILRDDVWKFLGRKRRAASGKLH